jgi:ribosomal protein S18 acetylase RimI-like enzyme
MAELIRPYQPTDRAAVRAICCDTAFMGHPMDRFFDDREILADALSRYYTDFEPEKILVAEVEGKISGYFFGCTHSHNFRSTLRWRIAPMLAAKGFARGVLWRPGTRRFVFRVIGCSLKGKIRIPEVPPEYPAHLHINLLDSCRGHGLGVQLMETGLDSLRTAGAKGAHLQTLKQNTRAVAFFRRCGFESIHEGSADLWPPEAQPLNTLTMARKL